MYAVIQTGGKQYKVQVGDIVQIEKLSGEVGTSVNFDQVLFASAPTGSDAASQIWVGKPLLSGASVQGELVGQGRGEKVLIIKMKRRKQYRRTKGHRQEQTQFLVTAIDNGAGQNAKLSDADKKTKLASFNTQLAPRGGVIAAKALKASKAEGVEVGTKAASKPSTKKAPAKKATTTSKKK